MEAYGRQRCRERKLQIKQGLFLDDPEFFEFYQGHYTVEWPTTDREGRRMTVIADHAEDGGLKQVAWGQYTGDVWYDGFQSF